MRYLLLVVIGCIATRISAQWPSGSADPHLSLQLSPPAASPTPNLPYQPLTMPIPPAPGKPYGVQNPKELTPPLKLVHADMIWEGGDFGGKLRGANGKEFWFYRGGIGWPPSDWTVYVGYMSGNIPPSARANYAGWAEIDFCTILETAIRSQFRWDPLLRRLVPKDLSDFDDDLKGMVDAKDPVGYKRVHYETFGARGVKRMLKYAERYLGRQQSYMVDGRPNQSLQATADRRE